jgi:uncharacterized protein (UPF0548 family)
MEVDGITLGRRSPARLDQLLRAAVAADLSYHHVGSTLTPEPPSGVPERLVTREVDGSLAAATAALRAWALHRGIRGAIHPAEAALAIGTTLLVVAPFGPFQMAVPDRIVGLVDDPERFGFAYGTLDGHAEAGEELFLAEQVAPGRLRLTLRIHARPGTTLARIGTPVVILLQRAAARRYLDAWSEAIRRADS